MTHMCNIETPPAKTDAEKLLITIAALKNIASQKQTASYNEVEAWELQDAARAALRKIKG